MDFEKLLTFIVIILIWGGSSILGKIGKALQKKQPTGGQQPGFFQILQQNLAALKETDQGEEVLEFDEYFQPAPQPLANQRKNESLIERAEESLPQEPSTTSRATASDSTTAGKAKPPRPNIIRKGPCVSGINRRKLQNAVIWAEILAPPVALREQ